MPRPYRAPIMFNGHEIKAAGVLLYAVDSDQKIWVLLRTTKNKGFSDFGGKNEPSDQTPLDLAIRKCVSESCQVLEAQKLKEIIDPEFYDHIKGSKYILYYAKIDKIDLNEMQSRDVEMEGNHEFKWFLNGVAPKHCRIAPLNIIQRIKQLEEKERK
ncbi:Conserved_hypothetical protein [Hexamita inflata]|uniref:Nudix hydrolase domain-containing protein n=1 Tax=Hexamita inflata TaxID=28002 RepID=A0AA86RP48_9EUKA|nr:Conserved hypothetical protein [Hexamita inflata]